MKYLSFIFSALILLLANSHATETLPKDWQLGFSEPATELMSDVISFHSYIYWYIYIGLSFASLHCL